MKAIIAAVDFSPLSSQVVKVAAELARGRSGKIVLLTVLTETYFAPEFSPPGGSATPLASDHEQTVRSRLTAIQQRLAATGVPAEILVRRGNPAGHILEESQEHDAAYIIVGSHGHSALFDLVLGSTSQSVLNRAKMPVVVVPFPMRRSRRSEDRAGQAEPKEATL